MSGRVAVFVDAEFLKVEGAKTLGLPPPECRVDARAAVRVLREAAEAIAGDRLLRLYWYEGRLPASDQGADGQGRYLDAISLTPGLSLRLGTVKSVTPPWMESLSQALEKAGVDIDSLDIRVGAIRMQKGVDTLIVLDLVRVAQKRAASTALLICGDRDLLEAVRVAQDEGCFVVVGYPEGAGLDATMRRTADEVRVFDRDFLSRFLGPKSAGDIDS